LIHYEFKKYAAKIKARAVKISIKNPLPETEGTFEVHRISWRNYGDPTYYFKLYRKYLLFYNKYLYLCNK